MALEYCSSLASEKRDDANSVMVDGEERVLKNVEEVESVKVPVKLLLVCVLHMVQGDTESRLKGLYRLFKEWWWSGGMIVSKESKTMKREEFEEVVKSGRPTKDALHALFTAYIEQLPFGEC